MKVGQVATYRNVYQFKGDFRGTDPIPEVAHDGHQVRVIRQFDPDPTNPEDVQDGPMYMVRCVQDGAEFDAFTPELDPEEGQ